MTLIPDFARVYLKLWSVQLGGLTLALEILEFALPAFADRLPPWLSIVLLLLILGARALKQSNLDGSA